MEYLLKILHEGKHSLVVEKNGIRTFDSKGIADLYALFTKETEFLKNARVADKVVGKGAAALMILGGVDEVYADVISIPAIRLLQHSDVKVGYGVKVPNIINRRGDGICPVESLCSDIESAKECLPLIVQFMKSNKSK